jgi:hypothetical protein
MDSLRGIRILSALIVGCKTYKPKKVSLLRYAFLLGMAGIPQISKSAGNDGTSI